MNKKRLWIGLGLAVVLIVVVIGYGWHGGTSSQAKFRTLPVMRGELFIGVTATGTVEPVEIIDVGAQIVGSIRSFGPDPDREGKTIDFRSRVKKGAILAQLDDSPHRAEWDKAKANLKLAEAELSHYQAKLRQAKRDMARAEELRDTDSVADYENAVSSLDVARADLTMAEAKWEQAKIATKQAEINLNYTIIRSPVDGVVIDRRVNVGQTVVAGMNAPSLFLLAKDLRRMLVWAAVNEADIGDIRIGQKVTFKVDAYRDRTFDGKVSQIRLNAGITQNVVSYGVVVDVDNHEGLLLPYMTAKLQFEVARHPNVMLVPNQALRWQPTWDQITPSAREGLTRPEATSKTPVEQHVENAAAQADTEPKVETKSPTVWTLADDGLVRPVAVKTGLTDNMVTEITGGRVKPGDPVIVGTTREAQLDFVSGFINKVTNQKKK